MIKAVFTDLDGTLLNDNKQISRQDEEVFKNLGKKEILRIAATGRSIELVKQVIPKDFQFDYVIFSSGAGIYDWRNNRVIYARHLSSAQVKHISQSLAGLNVNFMIQNPIPGNHYFKYYENGSVHGDFIFRKEKYKHLCQRFDPFKEEFGEASQFLVILSTIESYNNLKGHFTDVKIIRATSPLDGKSIWMEFFHKEVSKGQAAQWLCQKYNVGQNQTLAVGNDYNDIELLDFTHYSYAVSNAIDELKESCFITESNNASGVSEAIWKHIL